ncbi:MAG: hypothetical protein WBY94_11580 [Polyangiaceae bacterium]|jgi:hypothetical protein
MQRRALAASPVLALVMACASPTLPLPPPEEVSVGLGPDADHVTLIGLCGGTPRNVFVVVINEGGSKVPVPLDQSVGGARTDPTCGKWDATVFAHSGDLLSVTYDEDEFVSQSLLIGVP